MGCLKLVEEDCFGGGGGASWSEGNSFASRSLVSSGRLEERKSLRASFQRYSEPVGRWQIAGRKTAAKVELVGQIDCLTWGAGGPCFSD